MTLGEIIFGRRPQSTFLTDAPAGVHWRQIRPKRGPAIEAHLAQDNGFLRSPRGHMRYRVGKHYLITRQDGSQSVVKRPTFERTYQQRADGQFEKRTDITYRYFTLPDTVVVATLEGPQRADSGDWIVEGVDGELWPVKRERAREIYDAA
ncbi:MAG: hypothetical protein QM759_13855 [Terricaulis sp.]